MSEDEEYHGEDEGIYAGDVAEDLGEADEIDEVEEGFMKGYKEGARIAKCANCGSILSDDESKVVEHEHEGKMFRFCSSKCADEFEQKHREEE